MSWNCLIPNCAEGYPSTKNLYKVQNKNKASLIEAPKVSFSLIEIKMLCTFYCRYKLHKFHTNEYNYKTDK